jgi:outer membrane protein assembly factor BamE (lipoprotein component of BamABCDE complex)
VRGNHVDADALKELVPGTSTRADVTSLIGSPTIKAPFDDNSWIYIGETTKPVIGGTQAVLNQNVVVLNFNPGGVLSSITKKNGADSMQVSVNQNATPSPGSDASILQQLLGNVGKFSPGGSLPSSGGSSNRSGTSGN